MLLSFLDFHNTFVYRCSNVFTRARISARAGVVIDANDTRLSRSHDWRNAYSDEGRTRCAAGGLLLYSHSTANSGIPMVMIAAGQELPIGSIV